MVLATPVLPVMDLHAESKYESGARKQYMCGAVVFGLVKEGMPVVRKMETCGSSSGRTRQAITIADCGELPSRRQILAKLAAEKEALANMKKDPILV